MKLSKMKTTKHPVIKGFSRFFGFALLYAYRIYSKKCLGA